MKRLLATALVLVIALSLCACGFTSRSTTTTTTTTTNADGTTTTETTTTTTENGNSSTVSTTTSGTLLETLAKDGEVHTIDMTVANGTADQVITGFRLVETGITEWSNLFDENTYLKPGESLTGTFTFDKDSLLWDIGVDDADGQTHELNNCDLSTAYAENFTLTFTYDANDGWSVFWG